MDSEKRKSMESVFSKKIRAGRRRTYFFDVRQTKGEDYYLTMTESTKRFNGTGYERHKIFLYKEDFNRFLTTLEEVINHVKTELMPDFDYDEFTRRHEEYERMRAEEQAKLAAEAAEAAEAPSTSESEVEEPSAPESTDGGDEDTASGTVESEEDISW